MTPRQDVHDFDTAVRTALHDVARVTTEGPGLADRLIANARAGDPVADLRSRRAARWTMPLLAAAAVVALAIGGVVTAHLASQHNPRSPHPVGTQPTHTRTTQAHRPAVTAPQVENGTIDVPSWNAVSATAGTQCRSGRITFHDGKADMPGAGAQGRDGYQFLGRPAIEDVDGDGSDDAVVVLLCAPHQPVAYRVLALQGVAGGGIEVTGDVVAPVDFTRSEGSVNEARVGQPASVAAGSDGTVSVTWNDAQPTSANVPPTQVRSYRDDGGTWRQVAGPTEFPDRSADLSVSAPDATLTKGAQGAEGSLRVTVRNAGPKASGPDVTVIVDGPGLTLLGVTNTDGSHVSSDLFAPHQFRVFLADFAPGTSRTVLFRFRYAGTGDPRPATVDVTGGVALDPTGNNTARVAFTVR